jgi:hypothetical protein
MPQGVVARVLTYVGILLLLTLASTFPWWASATIVRAEYRRLLSALACSMRVFFYSICLLCILVAARSVGIGPADPSDRLFGWIHLGGTLWIHFPSAWRAFRLKGPRLVACVLSCWTLCAALGAAAWCGSAGFRRLVGDLPRYMTTG